MLRERGWRHRQGGFSLVELSVAMVIALFLVAGLFTLEQSTRKTSSQQTQLAQLQDNERLAMTIMTDVIQNAGFFADPSTSTAVGSLPTAPAPTFFQTAGQAVYGTTTGGLDSIYVQYMSEGSRTDGLILCNGQPTTDVAIGNPGIAYINQFSIQQDPTTKVWQLACTVSTNIASTVTALTATPVVLVEGIEKLQILYGLATAGTNGNSVDTYWTATQIAADITTNRWLQVSSVKVVLTFTNPLKGQAGQANTINFERVIGIMNRTGA